MNKTFQQIYRECYQKRFPDHPHESQLLFTPHLLEAVELYVAEKVNSTVDKNSRTEASLRQMQLLQVEKELTPPENLKQVIRDLKNDIIKIINEPAESWLRLKKIRERVSQ